jgi:hypothetical protein
MVAVFPRALLRERSHSWNLVAVAASAGSGILPSSVVRSDGGGFWQCSMKDISLSGMKGMNLRGRDRQKVSTLLWRSIQQLCDGGVNPIVVPRNDALFRPMPAGEKDKYTPHNDGSGFSDGSSYYQPTIWIEAGSNASLRATTMYMRLKHSADLQGGEAFSIEHPNAGWRMYSIATVAMEEDDLALVTFMPPLREAITAGTYLEFDRPRCTLRLRDPNSMDLTVQPWAFNSASVDFVEATW